MKVTVENGNQTLVLEGLGTVNLPLAPLGEATIKVRPRMGSLTMPAGILSKSGLWPTNYLCSSGHGYALMDKAPQILGSKAKTEEPKMNVSDIDLYALVEGTLCKNAYIKLLHPGQTPKVVTSSMLEDAYRGVGLMPCSSCCGGGVQIQYEDGTVRRTCSIGNCTTCGGTGIKPTPKTKLIKPEDMTFDECTEFLRQSFWPETVKWLEQGMARGVIGFHEAAVRAVGKVAHEYHLMDDQGRIETPV